MPPKRKRVGPEPTSTPTEAPRRSSRRNKKSTTIKDDPLEEMGDVDNPHAIEKPSLPLDTKEGVERAMRDMGEMEIKLKNASRKQRLAVENSDLTKQGFALLPQAPPKPKIRPLEQKVVNQKPHVEHDAVDEAKLELEDECDIAMAEKEEGVTVDEEPGPERGARRPPPVNSDRLPLPWTGRLGYACLNTYLRTATPPVFSSRTCRMSSIIEHRHPLKDPSQSEHAVKNRPDKEQPADIARGQNFVQQLGLANAKDIVKMLRWNDKYGIKFMRLSSEMFPFASHEEHGYKLAPFASEVLAEAGRVAGELGHRVTTHPGQFTQIASPRKEVVTAAMRDLEYHNEMLSLLKLPEQQDRDAVMILHMGGTYGDKPATLNRFRENYVKLSDGVKRRLVLENDDVAWTVHDLLPICEELNIPMVLDFHHHNIMFDPSIREGTLDIINLYDRIKQTWTRKNIRQKMHYSEQTAKAVTPRDRRKHSARVRTLPPCAPDMDLMIEAKDKEQAVFELMRAFKLPGWERFRDVVPHERDDEPRKEVRKKKKKGGKKKKSDDDDEPEEDEIEIAARVVSDEDFAMGGPDQRVYWPEGMEDWLRPKKRELKKSAAGPKQKKEDEED